MKTIYLWINDFVENKEEIEQQLFYENQQEKIFKVGYSATDNKYYAKYSSDNENWTTFISYDGSSYYPAYFSLDERIGYFNSSSNSSLSIDMKETFMTKNNQIVWQGVI